MGARVQAAHRTERRAAEPVQVASPAAVGVAPAVLLVQRQAGNQATVSALKSSPPVGKGGAARLPLFGDKRRAAFAEQGRKLGLTPEQIDELWTTGSRASDGGGFAPAAQRYGALYEAAKSSAATGIATFYIQMKVGNLAQLNEKGGHADADQAMREVREMARHQLTGHFAHIHPVAERASGFGFIVAPKNKTGQDGVQRIATQVANSVHAKTRVPVEALAMTADEAATNAAISDNLTTTSARTARREANEGPQDKDVTRDEALRKQSQRPSDDTLENNETPTESVGVFTSVGADRRTAFLAAAGRYNVKEADAQALYKVMLESRTDDLTHFENAADREGTVVKAAEHVANAGVAAMYVEIDIRNLGGLNLAKGKSQTDKVFLEMTTITEGRMAELGATGLADAMPFRHGGDEFSFVVVARSPKISRDKLAQAVYGALKKADADVAAATEKLSNVAHTKGAKRKGGTGIVWGTSFIEANESPKAVFSRADQQVEAKKK